MIYKKYEDFLESISNEFNYVNDVLVPIFQINEVTIHMHTTDNKYYKKREKKKVI